MKGLANVGDVLAGKYKVEKILGIGGMGMVVAAMHLELDQKVALKFMLPAAMESPEASARFLREARAAGRLNNEHICRVIDVGRFDSGAPYIVMEYMEGYDLGSMLKRRGPLRIGNAVDYILQACEGLAEAHSHGIIHRDLKPDNLFLTLRSDGVRIIKVLDFGISKAAVTGIATRTGDILGSPAYMAPEQMRSTKDVDARADVWSLGVVLYQLLGGRLPFGGDSLPTLCLSVLNDQPVPLRDIREDLPEELWDVVARTLTKEREDRYPDVGELAQALLPFASADGVGSVTRVRSMLRGRQDPSPSETFPLGFSSALMPAQQLQPTMGMEDPDPPTVPFEPVSMPGWSNSPRPTTTRDLGKRPSPALPSSSQPVPLLRRPTTPPVAERPVGTTTVSGSSGESMAAIPRSRISLGLVGGLLGAIGLVVVLIVMVMRSGGGTDQPASQARLPGPPPPVIEVIDASTLRVEPIPPDADTEARVDDAALDLPDEVEPIDGSGTGSAEPPHKRRIVRDVRKDTRRKPDAGVGAGSSTQVEPPPPSPDAAVDDEDKWNHMQHDTPKLVPELKKAP